MSREPLKPGDLCLLLPGGVQHQEFVGQIHTLGRSVSVWAYIGHPVAWGFDPPVHIGESELFWSPQNLRKLDNPGDDEVDEISTRREVTA